MPGRRRKLRFLRWQAADWADWIGLNNCRKKRVVLFRRVAALDYCNFELYPDEILAVISDNWAGKSTLIKAVSARLSPAKAKSNSGAASPLHLTDPRPATECRPEMTGPTPELLDDLSDRINSLPAIDRRRLIAVAGPPASGKSTLGAALVARLNRNHKCAALIPMDGFHLDNCILTARGWFTRKGAPETFDAAGFIHMIQRLVTDEAVVIRGFDRARDIAIAGAQTVDTHTTIAVVEGNYLLLNEPPWASLQARWDLSVYLDVPLGEIERRSIQGWLANGMPPEEAEARARSNDLPNAVRVIDNSKPADIVI